MTDLKSAEELISRALVDLEALEELVENRQVADEIYGFLAQQAVEKALKAWLALLGRQYSITHNLDQLAREIQEAGIRLPSKDMFTELNPYAVQFRYESIDESEPELDRKIVLKEVGVLVEKVRVIITKKTGDGPGVREPRAEYRPGKRKAKPVGRKPARVRKVNSEA
jgi:HEPN domain-containing protein